MRTYIVTDQPYLRSAIQFLLDHQPNIRVIAEVDKIKILLAQIEAARPELIMLDWEMLGGDSAIELVTTLHALEVRPKIVALSVRSEVEPVALQAGADIFINKSDSPEKLVTILRQFNGQDAPPTEQQHPPPGNEVAGLSDSAP